MEELIESLIEEIDFWTEMIELEKDGQPPEIVDRMKRARTLAEKNLSHVKILAYSEPCIDEE